MVFSPHVHKGRWTKEEDEILTASVKPHLTDGMNEDSLPWSRIAQNIPNRTGIQCQARWTEALDPSVRKGRWRKEEDDMLKTGVERFGCCWIRVAGSIPGRTQRQCRTRWNQIQSKRQKVQGASNNKSTAAANAVKKQPQRKRKRADGEVKRWKPSSHQQAVNALSATPIQLADANQTPYILLNKQPSNAIVIPSEILSPLASPASTLSSMEEDDYFCTSPVSTSSIDTFNSSPQQLGDVSSPLTAIDAASILDDFDSSFTSLISSEKSSSNNDSVDLMFTSLFSSEFLDQFDLDMPSQQSSATIALENLLFDSEFFLNHSSANPTLLPS